MDTLAKGVPLGKSPFLKVCEKIDEQAYLESLLFGHEGTRPLRITKGSMLILTYFVYPRAFLSS
jgi:hypothetical protein